MATFTNTSLDVGYKLRYVGIFDGTTDGQPCKFTIKISEYLGAYLDADASKLVISVWGPNDDISYIGDLSSIYLDEQGVEGASRNRTWEDNSPIVFTNLINPLDITANTPTRYYPEVVFDDAKFVFTPIGILTFRDLSWEYSLARHTYYVGGTITNILDSAKIPTICIGRTPAGLDSTSYEAVNLINPRRKNSFLGTVTDTIYYLVEQNLNTEIYVTADLLQSDGTYVTLDETSGLTVDRTLGKVTFDSAPGASPISGHDNIIITYGVVNTKQYTLATTQYQGSVAATYTLSHLPISWFEDKYYYVQASIDGASEEVEEGTAYTVDYDTGVITMLIGAGDYSNITFRYSYYVTAQNQTGLICYYNTRYVTVFGYQNDKRIFVSDGTNTDIFSDANDITYFPDINYTVLGDETEVVGYGRTGGYLFTFKKGEDSVQVRYGNVINNVVVFPSIHSLTGLNVIGSPIENPNGELLLPTDDGVNMIYYDGNTVKHELRSHYVDSTIPKDSASWLNIYPFVKENILYLPFDGDWYIADLVQKTYSKDSASSTGTRYSSATQYQYEWYKWEDMLPGKNVTGTDEIHIYNENEMFKVDFSTNTVDTIDKPLQNYYNYPEGPSGQTPINWIYKPLEAYWETPFIDFNNINIAKTIRDIYLNTRSMTGDYFEIGYILPDGTNEILEKVYGTLTDVFPKLIQIKSKIKKFMNVKLYIKNRSFIQENNVTALTYDGLKDLSILPSGILSYTNNGQVLNIGYGLGTNTDQSIWLMHEGTPSLDSTEYFTIAYNNTNATSIYRNFFMGNPAYAQPLWSYKVYEANTVYSIFYEISNCNVSCPVTLSTASETLNPFTSDVVINITPTTTTGFRLVTTKTDMNGKLILRGFAEIPALTNASFKIRIAIVKGDITNWEANALTAFKDTTFNRMVIEYQKAGKYRGD